MTIYKVPKPAARKKSPRKPLKSGGRVKPRNVKRFRKNHERAYGGDSRVAFVQSLPCLVCLKSPCEVAHVRSGGISRKSDARFTVALCNSHHRELHQIGAQTFERKYNWVDLNNSAEATEIAWKAQQLLEEKIA